MSLVPLRHGDNISCDIIAKKKKINKAHLALLIMYIPAVASAAAIIYFQ